MALTPPAMAAVQSPLTSARQACAMATNEEEQAVSTTMDGPLSPYACEILPLKNARNVPNADMVSHRLSLQLTIAP